MLNTIAQTLNQLAFDHNVAVVSVNHITTRMLNNTTRIYPALGEQWTHCIANRVMMFWQQNYIRTACLVKSPSRPQGIAQYTINQLGIRDFVAPAPTTVIQNNIEVVHPISNTSGNGEDAGGEVEVGGNPHAKRSRLQ